MTPLPGRHPRTLLAAALVFPLAWAALGWLPAGPRAAWLGEGVVAFAPDGRTLVTSGADGARIRDAVTGRPRAVLRSGRDPVELGVNHCTFSPDGRLFLAEVRSDALRPVPSIDLLVWEVATGRQRDRFPYVADQTGARAFALSADGSTLAVADNAERLPVQVQTAEMLVERNTRLTLHWNANPGRTRVKVWDLRRRAERCTVAGRPPLALNGDGSRLAAADPDWKVPEVSVWDAAAGRRLTTLDFRRPEGEAHPGELTFSPDGSLLASNGYSDVQLWDWAAGRRLAVSGRGNGSTAPLFSPDGRRLFPAGRPRWNSQVGEALQVQLALPFRPWDLAADPPRRIDLPLGIWEVDAEGRRAVIVSPDRSWLTFLDLADGRPTAHGAIADFAAMRLDPTGRRLAVETHWYEQPPRPHPLVEWLERRLSGVVLVDRQPRDVGQIQILDARDGRPEVEIPLPDRIWGGVGLAFAPDGATLAVSYAEGTSGDPGTSDHPRRIELWDIPPRPPRARRLALAAALLGWRLDARARRRARPAADSA